MRIVITSGGFDPLHSGHIEYLKAARSYGNKLVVGINSDAWLIQKKGNYFLPWNERAAIIRHLSMVDEVRQFNDADGTALDLLKMIRRYYPFDHLVVANGGDRTSLNNAEASFEDNNCEFVFGVGGTQKVNASSLILKRWKDLS